MNTIREVVTEALHAKPRLRQQIVKLALAEGLTPGSALRLMNGVMDLVLQPIHAAKLRNELVVALTNKLYWDPIYYGGALPEKIVEVLRERANNLAAWIPSWVVGELTGEGM